MPALEQAGDRLVKGSVAARAHDQIKFRGTLRHNARRIAAAGGGVDRDVVAAAVKDVHDSGECAAGFFLAGAGVENQ